MHERAGPKLRESRFSTPSGRRGKSMQPRAHSFAHLCTFICCYPSSDIAMEILPDDVANNNSVAEGVGSSVIVREKGHYFGKCIYFDPPDLAPVGMDNKVIDK